MTNLCILQDYELNSVFNHFSLAKKVIGGYVKKTYKDSNFIPLYELGF